MSSSDDSTKNAGSAHIGRSSAPARKNTAQDALGKALATRRYDVIITYAGDLAAIQPQLASISHEPALIPVFPRNVEEATLKQYPLALNENANINQFLKTIEETMRSRGT